MIMNSVEKVTAEHLKRDAYLYIRQSSLKQVMHNTESTKRQYALRERAVALGWTQEQVVVIDSDLGESAAPGAADRAGFERLMTDVSMGRAGLVMGLEVSRLARSCSAWHRLLEICALTRTLVLDQDGLYDVGQINDRLLLGLKAAMSEAELHMIRERMRGGALSKAARGELRVRLPVGFVYDDQNRVVLDPDKQVQEAVRLFFKTFARLGSAYKTARHFHEQGLKFPKRIHCGPTKGELVWAPLTQVRASQVLHNPKTPHRERKRMAALLIEDVTLIKNGQLSVNVRFKGGATRSLTLARPLAAYERWTTSKEVVAEIDRLLDDHTYDGIAAILNEKGYGSGQGRTFDRRRVSVIRRAYGLQDRYTRLHAQGYLTAEEVAPKLGTTSRMVRIRRTDGTLPVGYRKLSDKGDCMYEDPDAGKARKTAGMLERTEEV